MFSFDGSKIGENGKLKGGIDKGNMIGSLNVAAAHQRGRVVDRVA